MIGEAQGDSRKAVESPSDRSPVKHAIAGGPSDRFGRARLEPEWGRGVVEDPFGGAPIKQGGTDSSAEQHGGPTEARVGRG